MLTLPASLAGGKGPVDHHELVQDSLFWYTSCGDATAIERKATVKAVAHDLGAGRGPNNETMANCAFFRER